MDRKQHWENIYRTRPLNEVSWYQPVPETSLSFLKQFRVPSDARIIDIGGGDSFFADNLLALRYRDITVLDISEAAIERAKKRLGESAGQVKWIIADAASFQPPEKYDFWHDRATFHFLTDEEEISNYLNTAWQNINPGGILVIGSFSERGPKSCSGIEIRQYSENSMTERLKELFEKINCTTTEHTTPSNTLQHFVFCSFRKRSGSVKTTK
jgi:2-polyprenyl-3-methyl-5-hydroxy-6-metoxy-1,4-benzoquinol methylase